VTVHASLVAVLTTWTALTPGGAHAGINRWTTSGPAGAHIFALTIDPSAPTTVYAGADPGGVFKSQDSGGSVPRSRPSSRGGRDHA
jgi:hypothetical protein